MVSGEKGQNTGQSGDRKRSAARAARLKAALRENLKRRKVQARSRGDLGADLGPAHDSAGIVPDKSGD
jgi:hypothetical protein